MHRTRASSSLSVASNPSRPGAGFFFFPAAEAGLSAGTSMTAIAPTNLLKTLGATRLHFPLLRALPLHARPWNSPLHAANDYSAPHRLGGRNRLSSKRLVSFGLCVQERQFGTLRLQHHGSFQSDEGVASSCSKKLCVAIDLAAQRIYGHTELEVAAKQGGKVGGVIGLHAQDLHIEQVLVDGVEANFEVLNPHNYHEANLHDGPDPAPYTKSHLEAADGAYCKYCSDLYVKVEVRLENGFSQSAPDSRSEATNLVAITGAQSEEVKIVRVEYWVEKPPSGAHFEGDVFYTNNQLRRARCWFPCVDSTLQRCSFDLEFTVHSEYVAVSNGKLHHQVYSKEGTHLKTYVYSLPIPTTASSVSLVVALLVVLPDRHLSSVSHFCWPGMDAALNASTSTFHIVFSLYEEYLGAPFPFGCYEQVFLPGDAVISTSSIGATFATFSADLLADERIIDQAIGTRIKLAHSLAQQWFGIFITPDSPADGDLNLFMYDGV